MTNFKEKINDMTLTELEKEYKIVKQRNKSDNIDRSNLENWIRDLEKIKEKKESEKLISNKFLKGLGLETQ